MKKTHKKQREKHINIIKEVFMNIILHGKRK